MVAEALGVSLDTVRKPVNSSHPKGYTPAFGLVRAAPSAPPAPAVSASSDGTKYHHRTRRPDRRRPTPDWPRVAPRHDGTWRSHDRRRTQPRCRIRSRIPPLARTTRPRPSRHPCARSTRSPVCSGPGILDALTTSHRRLWALHPDRGASQLLAQNGFGDEGPHGQ